MRTQHWFTVGSFTVTLNARNAAISTKSEKDKYYWSNFRLITAHIAPKNLGNIVEIFRGNIVRLLKYFETYH